MSESYDVVVSALQVGDTIGTWVIVRVLGEGGMGKVFLAEDPVTGKRVAIKMLQGIAAANKDVIARFRNEAAAMRKLKSKSFVLAQQFGVEKERPYVVMEFLEGRSLGDLMRDERRLAVGRASQILIQCARALAEAHDVGIIHRDVKPDNFFLVRGETIAEEVKVLDLGIAKFVSDEQRVDRTKSNLVMGTLHTMSPEQCLGAGKVDLRSDIYSLGIVGYYLLAGMWPFDFDDGMGAFIVAHMSTPPPPLREVAPWVPAELTEVIHACLAKQPERRYQTMRELADALAPFADVTMPLPVNLPTVQAPRQTSTTHSSSSGEVRVPLPQPSQGAKPLAGYAVLGVAIVALAATGTVFVAKSRQSSAKPSAEATEAPVKSVDAPREATPAVASPAVPQGRVLLTSTPPGASVTIAGKARGQTPLLLSGKPGETINAQLALDGYEEHNADVVISDVDRKEEVRLTAVAKNEQKPTPKARTERRSKSTSPKGDDYVSNPFAK